MIKRIKSFINSLFVRKYEEDEDNDNELTEKCLQSVGYFDLSEVKK